MNKKRIMIYVIVALTIIAVFVASKMPSEEPEEEDSLVQTESIEEQMEDMPSDQSITSSEQD